MAAAFTESSFRQLCQACDRLLLAPDAPADVLAVTWLHVLREHPAVLAPYLSLIQEQPPRRLQRLLARGRQLAQGASELWRSVGYRGAGWHAAKPLPESLDLIFVSHLLNPAQKPSEDDFYFGGLPAQLHALGYRVAIVLLNHTSAPAEALASRWKETTVPRIVLSRVLRFPLERRLRSRMAQVSAWLSSRRLRASTLFDARVASQAAFEALGPAARSALRIREQMKTLLADIPCSAVLTTLEGHAWEHLVRLEARQQREPALCLAYQHAAVFRFQHAIRRSLGSGSNPDHVFACGEITAGQLARHYSVAQVGVSVLGSPRASAEPGGTRATGDACLVMPEGLEIECESLFGFSLDCAARMPGMRFIWRLHPVLRWADLLETHPQWRELPSNVRVSSGTLQEDYGAARYVLYRGTTAVLGAISAGLKPVYLATPGEMTIDPLYELKEWREEVTEPGGFLALEARCRAATDDQDALVRAQDYCRRYYTPLDAAPLLALLTSKLPGDGENLRPAEPGR